MSSATLFIRAHFDGRFIVPDEPVNLPINAPLKIVVKHSVAAPELDPQTIRRKLAALDRFTAHGISGLDIADETLRRENVYGDEAW